MRSGKAPYGGRSGARRRRSFRSSPSRAYGIGFAIVAVVLVVGIAAVLRGHWYLDWLLGWGVVTFFAYGWDKRQAIRSGERVPEVVLHGLALVGGVAGGWAGRSFYHHKTRKPAFAVVLSIATVLYGGILLWLLLRGAL